MKGLLLKDFMNLEKIGKQYLVIFLGMTVVAVATKNPSFVAMFIILCGSMAVISSFSFDEYTRFDIYIMALPVRRKDVVKEKYILMLILMVIPIIVGTVLSIAVHQLIDAGNVMELIGFSVGMGSALYMAYAIMLPFIFKMGVEKARIIMIVSYVFVFGMIYLLSKIVFDIFLSATRLSQNMQGILFLMLLLFLDVLFFFVSYIVSKGIMMKKEF